MADKVLDPDFEQIIMLTAMMTKRSQKREEEVRAADAEPLETLLEERSRKSLDSGHVSQSSGSGLDIDGNGHPAYENQSKGGRRAGNLF